MQQYAGLVSCCGVLYYAAKTISVSYTVWTTEFIDPSSQALVEKKARWCSYFAFCGSNKKMWGWWILTNISNNSWEKLTYIYSLNFFKGYRLKTSKNRGPPLKVILMYKCYLRELSIEEIIVRPTSKNIIRSRTTRISIPDGPSHIKILAKTRNEIASCILL